MGLPELACRGRQEARKWLDRMVVRPGTATAAGSSTRPPVTLDDFRREIGRRFFRGPLDPDVPSVVRIQMPEACQDLIAAADARCGHRFDVLGYRDVSFGNPVDWHLDPISGRQAPQVHWSLLKPLDASTVGDSKVVWELNRHQWLVGLAQAYRLTGDPKYAETATRYWRSWLDANPPGCGINWASSLEASLRLIAWCWTLALMKDAEALTPELFGAIVTSIEAHATHIERYLSYYFSPNTHLTGEALGLLYAGVVFREFKAAARWRRLAARLLAQESERQVLPDGVYFEQSTCYQRYTIDIYLHYLVLSTIAGCPPPAAVVDRLRRMVDFLVAIRRPDGEMPSLGDGDDGALLPLGRHRAADCRAMFSTAAALLREPAYHWAAGGPAPETVWMLGADEIRWLLAERSAPPDEAASRVFPAGGYAVMRSGWSSTDHYLLFDTGPLGCHVSAAHGHADLLSLQCSVFGQPFLVDAGTGCYTGDVLLRNHFRSSALHSTVTVDGVSQAQPAGPFGWQSRPSGRLRCWTSNPRYDFADAEHDAYCALPHPVVHRRRVLFVKPDYWVLVDDLSGAGTHVVELRFQFAPIDVELDASGLARATRDGRHGLLVQAFGGAPLAADIRQGGLAPFEGWVSPAYGQRTPAPVLVYTAPAATPLRIVTLLWPSKDVLHDTPAVAPLRAADDSLIGLTVRNTVIRFDGDYFDIQTRATPHGRLAAR